MSVEFIIVEVSIKTCTTECARHCNIKPQGREARINMTHTKFDRSDGVQGRA